MTLKQLEAFVKIANNRSFTLAAKELFITQPTVSAYINNLEESWESGCLTEQPKRFSYQMREIESTSMPKRYLSLLTRYRIHFQWMKIAR